MPPPLNKIRNENKTIILKMKKNLTLFLVSILIASSSFAQNTEALESINVDELKNHMYFLASDFLGGRVHYNQGYSIAAEYCATQFASVDIKPICKDEMDNLTYFQNVPLVKKKVHWKRPYRC